VSSPNSIRCYHETKTASHVVCDCEAVTGFWFCHLSSFFQKTDYHEIPLSRILCFIASMGLPADQKNVNAWETTYWSQCKGCFSTHTIHTHTHTQTHMHTNIQ
jgi:hypothetical protein